MSEVETVKELVAALNNEEPEIVIKGKLGTAIYVIHGIGPFAWGICFIAIGAAVYIGATATTAGTSTAMVHHTLRASPIIPRVLPIVAGLAVTGAGVATITVSLLGTYAFGIAVSIAVASGGLGILSLIRMGYRIKSKTSECLVLSKI